LALSKICLLDFGTVPTVWWVFSISLYEITISYVGAISKEKFTNILNTSLYVKIYTEMWMTWYKEDFVMMLNIISLYAI
jgi:hypothetical protein